MGDTRFSTVYLTLTSIQAIYHELHEKLEALGESARIEKIALDTLGFLIDFLKPFYESQRELEGDKYPTLNRVCLWCEKLKHHCQPNAQDSPQQAVMRKRHEDWLARKVIIQDLRKIATFLWPIFNQLRMLSHSDRNAVHAHVRTLLQAMAAAHTRAGLRACYRICQDWLAWFLLSPPAAVATASMPSAQQKEIWAFLQQATSASQRANFRK
ncbi:hypothetical protein DPX16_6447 [Anabarilius grahami]|uniref:Uncharacterized protein n=1 Tax=Anabarilius grahami TaxID=495550 RepID=A0A3N0YM70_ANAGA|nr:hypothetical protein DPX16_6447 [Anabarilius grahami]